MPAKNDDYDEAASSDRSRVGDGAPSEADDAAPDRLILSPEQRVSGVGVLTLQPSDAVHLPKADTGPEDAAQQPHGLAVQSDDAQISDINDEGEPGGPTPSESVGGGSETEGTETEAPSAPGIPPQQGAAGETSPDDDILDEAALRALVAEIVRSELQGVLGERITQNVRKLVRREIDRALAARDLS